MFNINFLDNKYLLRKVVVVEKKASACADDCSAIYSRIDNGIKSLLVNVALEYSSDKIKRDKSFHDNQGEF